MRTYWGGGLVLVCGGRVFSIRGRMVRLKNRLYVFEMRVGLGFGLGVVFSADMFSVGLVVFDVKVV